jgi:cytochrome P450
MWLITKYADARELLASRDTSNSLGRSESAASQPGFLLSLDPPDHTRIRRMLTGQFSMRRLAAMRPYIEEIATRFLDEMEAAGAPADLMQAFALPLPSLVICELLGVPFEDQVEFQRRSDTMLDVSVTRQQQAQNTREMNAYMQSLVNRHRKDPGDDILGMLIRDHADELTDEELLGIGNILLVAGHETTANTIGLGTLLLLQHPDQLALVRNDPEVITTAVEEILRYLTMVDTGTPRIILHDMIIGGQLIQAGDIATLALPSANRDPEFMTDADVFEVTRQPQAPDLRPRHPSVPWPTARASRNVGGTPSTAPALPYPVPGGARGRPHVPKRWSGQRRTGVARPLVATTEVSLAAPRPDIPPKAGRRRRRRRAH